MADPLSSVVDRMSPEPTNFFDPAQGQSIIARYGNAGIGLEDAEAAAGSAMRLRQARESRIARPDQEAELEFQRKQRERAEMKWAREDIEAEERQKALESKGQFYESLTNSLDPDAADYLDKRDALLATVPEAVIEEEGFKAILTSKDAVARENRAAAEKRSYRDQIVKDQNDAFLQRAIQRAAEAGVPPDKFPRDAEGNVVPDELMYLAGTYKRTIAGETKQADRAAAAAEYDRRQQLQAQEYDRRKRFAAQLEGSAEGKELKSAVQNQEVFPSQLAALMRQNPGSTEADLKLDQPEAYQAAKEYDAKKFESELGSAFNAQTAEDYVNLVEGKTGPDGKPVRLSEQQKELRRRVWRAARGMDAPATTGAAPAVTPTAVAAPEGKVGRQKMYKGVLHEYDGKGWKPVKN